MNNNILLEVKNVSKRFGGVQALENISFAIESGKITGVIGPNGAGKSTLFNVIVGIYRPDSGVICLEGNRIEGKRNNEIHKLGIARTFQNIRLFNRLTIFENVLSGGLFLKNSKKDTHFFKNFDGNLSIEYANLILEKIGLYNVKDEYPTSLDYGSRKKLEIGRCLMMKPKLLMLDEPAAGMNEMETIKLMDFIKKLADEGINLLIIEHDMHLMLNSCHEINVLNFGKLIFSGTPDEITKNREVREAYLGEDFMDARS